jgi:hypothetical protein
VFERLWSKRILGVILFEIGVVYILTECETSYSILFYLKVLSQKPTSKILRRSLDWNELHVDFLTSYMLYNCAL